MTPTNEQWQSLIDWVNSHNDPYCLLVSSFQDMLDGVALCHLVAMIVCSPEDQIQMKILINYDHADDSDMMFQNLDLALSVLKASSLALPEVVRLMETKLLVTNPLMFYLFVETLRQAQKLGLGFHQLQQSAPN
jgi:hypothetical protein